MYDKHDLHQTHASIWTFIDLFCFVFFFFFFFGVIKKIMGALT
jgi:hypothetical protein